VRGRKETQKNKREVEKKREDDVKEKRGREGKGKEQGKKAR